MNWPSCFYRKIMMLVCKDVVFLLEVVFVVYWTSTKWREWKEVMSLSKVSSLFLGLMPIFWHQKRWEWLKQALCLRVELLWAYFYLLLLKLLLIGCSGSFSSVWGWVVWLDGIMVVNQAEDRSLNSVQKCATPFAIHKVEVDQQVFGSREDGEL